MSSFGLIEENIELSHIHLSVLLDWEKHCYYQLELQTFTKHLSFSRNYMSISIFYRVILCKIKGKFWSLKSTVCFWKLVRKYIVILKSFALLVSLLQKLILFKHFICCTKKQKKFFFYSFLSDQSKIAIFECKNIC